MANNHLAAGQPLRYDSVDEGGCRRVHMPFQKRVTSCGVFWRCAALLLWAIAAVLASPAAQAFDANGVEPSVYKIYTFVPAKGDQFTISSGTGFLISGHRYVLTNFHVVEGKDARFFIAFRSGREAKLVEARLADKRPNVDLALLEAREDLPGKALRIGDYEPEKLAEVVAMGFPGAANLNKELVPGPDAQGIPLTDLDSTVTTGVVSRMTFTNLKVSESQILSARTVQHNSAINPGNSGGPLFDACGLVVGVNTLQGLNSQGLFFSIHAAEVGRFLREGQIPFSSTTSPCSSTFASSIGPLAAGFAALLALAAAAFVLRTRGAPAWLDALPKALAALGVDEAASAHAKKSGPGLLLEGGERGVLALRPTDGGPTIRLDEGKRTIGRGPGVDIAVASDTVSKVHARLSLDRNAERIRITDLGSSNGTYLNGARITEASAAVGATLRLGMKEFTVARETRAVEPQPVVAGGASGWMLSGFDPAGRAVQFELRPATERGLELPATWTFGRDPTRANFVIDDTSVSSLHAQLMFNPGEPLALRDMGSMNGTRLDGESIGNRTVILRDTGQEIAFGLANLRLSRLTA